MSDQNATPENTQPKNDDAPDWARKAISEANSEAAKYRVERNEFKRQLDEALGKNTELTDKYAAAESARVAAETELMKLRVALDAGVPGDRVRTLAERLQGSTEEELMADAKKLVEQFGLNRKDRATDPSQGRGLSGQAVANTPQAEFAQLISELPIFKR